MEGFSLGQKIDNKCGMRASSTGELVFQDVKVPTENLLGDIGVCVCVCVFADSYRGKHYI